MAYSLKKTASLRDLQKFNSNVYALTDDRLYSIWDLLVQQSRFAMRALKGIRKGDRDKTKLNLLISLSFLSAIANRLRIDIEDEVWARFPMRCSYCGRKPCVCREVKSVTRHKSAKINNKLRPVSLKAFQEMFNEIYPVSKRTITDAGIHLAEEIGEMSEAISNYLGQHLEKQFDDIKFEMADVVSCIFGVANSANIDCAKELSMMFVNNCHVCHKAPCICSFSKVIKTKS